MQTTFVKRSLLFLAIAWTLVIVSAIVFYLWSNQQQTIETVKTRARTLLERDMLYRSWGLTKNGLYVRVSKVSQPNPSLAFLPYRDVPHPDGGTLTMMTPSNVIQQAFGISNKHGDTVSKITSLRVVNTSNMADQWEREALLKLEEGVAEISEVTQLNGRPYVRTMRPFLTEKKCLKCHGMQGYKIGDVRGGISVSIPLDPAMAAAKRYDVGIVSLLIALWLMGLSGIFLQGRRLVRQTVLAMENARLRDQAEMSLHYMSNYDRHTNLPNRYLFEERLGGVLKAAYGQKESVAVIALEVRNLRRIVDIHGESLGRKFLKIIAERLVLQLGEDDLVARLSSERLLFTLIQKAGRIKNVSPFQSIEETLSQAIDYQEKQFFPMISMGIAFSPDDSVDSADLLQMASSSLERAVERGMSGFELYSRSLQAEAVERLAMESGLQVALAENQFFLNYQPQIHADTAEIIGFEALLRWKNSDGNLVSPIDFIPIAEENGLILPIGAWVLETACHQAVAFQQRAGRYLRTGVNVSAKQFRDPTLVDHIDRVLAATGLPPEYLEIEITENTFMDDPLKTVEILTDLKVRGVKIAIDDFGTGYSSLNYLKRFPVDRLKIDRSFIIDIVTNEDDRVLVSLITSLARGMGLEVIAEGVEEMEQRDILLNLDCSQMQGYLYSRPLSAEDFLSFLPDQPASQ